MLFLGLFKSLIYIFMKVISERNGRKMAVNFTALAGMEKVQILHISILVFIFVFFLTFAFPFEITCQFSYKLFKVVIIDLKPWL